MLIRRGTEKDAELLHQIGVKTFDDTFGGTCTKDDMKFVLNEFFSLEQCKKDLSDENDFFFFLEDNDTVKGYMRINSLHESPVTEWLDKKCVELVRLYVLKEFHGAGVANELMNYALNFAADCGFERMYLSVWEYNFRARGFYEKHGFKNSGVKNDFPLGSTPQTDYWFVRDL